MKGRRYEVAQISIAVWRTERGVSAVESCRETVVPEKAFRTLKAAGR